LRMHAASVSTSFRQGMTIESSIPVGGAAGRWGRDRWATLTVATA
jgi:hypothetical protein